MREIPIVSGTWYHIYNRGVSKMTIFCCNKDYQRFLDRFFEYKERYKIDCLAYCLMPNHFHILVQSETDSVSIEKFMHSWQMSFSKYFNCKYKHSGAVFESRYKAKPVVEENYLLRLMDYIHDNPQKDKMVMQSEAWEYSSLKEWEDFNFIIVDYKKFPLDFGYKNEHRTLFNTGC